MKVFFHKFGKMTLAIGTAYFLYNTDSTPQPEGGPSAWGAAAVISAVDEGLAGIVDNGINYDKMYFSPKFPVTHYTELRYFTGYEWSNTTVDVRYIMKAEGIRYDIISPAKTIQAHIFIPKGEKCSEVLVNSEKVSFEHIRIAESEYVDFKITELQGKVRIEILFKK